MIRVLIAVALLVGSISCIAKASSESRLRLVYAEYGFIVNEDTWTHQCFASRYADSFVLVPSAVCEATGR